MRAFALPRLPKLKLALGVLLPLALLGAAHIPWADLTEADWMYALATRFALVDGHKVHYPTPPEELAKLLEARKESAALRHLAEARLELGDRKGALAAMEKWAEADGPAAWDETARWAMAHQEMAVAFRAAERALPGLPDGAKHNLADQRIAWADRYPDLADPIALRKARAELFPQDPQALEDWLRKLEKANRLQEADRGLTASTALSAERRLLLRADLLADHGSHAEAFRVLDESIAQSWSINLRKAYANRVDKAVPGHPTAWRAALERRFDAAALVRLATYFQGKGRGDAVADLLRQMERRYEAALTRTDQHLVARLFSEIDAVPEAFRASLSAAHAGNPEEQKQDLVKLARLALQAGGRPLALGIYNDETYRWAARVDRTPGFWTGSAAFLLTGLDWKEAFNRLESESLPDRTFATARALAGELARRAPQHPDLPSLRVAIMERHVERGEGQAALALLPLVESGSPAAADEGRRIALLAMRQVEMPLADEVRLMQARFRFLAPDNSQPTPKRGYESSDDQGATEEVSEPRPWARSGRPERTAMYWEVLEESLARLEFRNPSHGTALSVILGELDRMPNAEDLWLNLASRLENWNLDDELGPRYQQALQRFPGSGIWARSARWYARRNLHGNLRLLAEEIASKFRGAAIFERAQGAGEIRVEIPDQPLVAGRVRLVLWADWVRFKALERFPHCPTVYREAQRLVTTSHWNAHDQKAEMSAKEPHGRVVVPDTLMAERRWALLFTDASERENYFSAAMDKGSLEPKLTAMEQASNRTPVEDLLLFEGWSRLSKFERAVGAADRLSSRYPGDGPLAQRVLSLHRSLNGLETTHAAPARALVERTAPALKDATALWTELGELEEERGRPEAAIALWRNLLEREPRNPQRITELATLLWDYNHDREALAVVEDGRKRLDRPRFFAFETGVLRENLKDLEGAVREYLDAVRPENQTGFGSWFEQDQRSLRRLVQLLARDRVYRIVERRIQSLQAGNLEDERTLAAFFPLATIEPPVPGFAWDADSWIDTMDLPNDPLGREGRADQKGKERPKEYNAILRIGNVLLEKSREMAPKATAREFLEAMEASSGQLMETRWQKDQILEFKNALKSRRAELTPDAEERIRLEMDRATFLAENHRLEAADAVWAKLDARIATLPEGAAKLKAEAGRAGYLERAKGTQIASAEWQRLSARYPWSLGLLEDRLAFLHRHDLGEAARTLLEQVAPRAAEGHREAFLERLTRDSLTASDLPRARRAVTRLLTETTLDGPRRLGALHLLARLSFRENQAWDPYPLAKAETSKLLPDLLADLFHELARAADLESAWNSALGLWIEALNRRTDRDWLVAACRSSQRGKKGDQLLAFFEKQHQRSPRDVRWAIAVRDIKRAFHDVEGALAAAQSAVAVRPEREQLWREAAELLVRADRIKEAADYLEGWNRPRAADEGVARWRSELYARAGEADKALAIEKAALEAFRKETQNNPTELDQRKARAAERLLAAGLPAHALRLYTPGGDITALAGSKLSADKQCTLALLLNQFPRLLGKWRSDAMFLQAAAPVLRQHGRQEQKEEVLTFLVNQLTPPGVYKPDDRALNQWWPFISGAGLEQHVSLVLLQRHLAARPGPWQTNPPLAFVASVAGEYIVSATDFQGQSIKAFREPDLARLWVRDLARRDRPEELLAFLEPRWQELLGQIKGPRALDTFTPRQAWAHWLDDPEVLWTWSRAVGARPDKIRELGELMSERKQWDRFWVLAARNWSSTPLVALLPQATRTAWFRFWESRGPEDAVLLARRHKVEDVTSALGALVQGRAGAANDPLIVQLRGPQTVGEVLGKNGQWVWSEFALRRTALGAIAEVGEHRVVGSGVDEGRLPGALWGDRPGEAWYVLETLVRYRTGDGTAPLVPLDVPGRGAESDRTLLALHLARAMKALPLALEIDSARPGAAKDRRRLEARITLLIASNQKTEAIECWQEFLRRGQAKLTEEEFRWHATLAEERDLPSPLDALDPQQPVGPAFLAYLTDRRKDDAGRFHTADPAGFKAALANRWRRRETQLSAEQIRYWLQELWAPDHAPLPLRGLAKLRGIWPHAGEWLARQAPSDRKAALAAVEEISNPKAAAPRLFTLLMEPTWDDVARQLAIRARLQRGEGDQALAVVDQMLTELRQGQALSLTVAAPVAFPLNPNDGEDEGEESAANSQPPPAQVASDPLVDRLRLWLKPFRDAKSAPPVEERFRKLLKERRDEGQISLPAWQLAFQLTPSADLPGLVEDLDKAWFRGEVALEQLGGLCETLAAIMPSHVPTWLARWPQSYGFVQARQRVAILAAIKQQGQASRLLLDSRRRALWPLRDEVQAFDLWRTIGAPSSVEVKAPATWSAALAFWTAKPDALVPVLADRLKAHPFDVLSARTALRSPAPANEDAMFRAALALEETSRSAEDRTVLDLKTARGLLPNSWRAARAALHSQTPEALGRLLSLRKLKSADINAAFGDLARLAGKAGDDAQLASALGLLAERKATNLKALRAELNLYLPAKQDTYRIVDGRPTPIRPRDLSWSLLAQVLKAEGVR